MIPTAFQLIEGNNGKQIHNFSEKEKSENTEKKEKDKKEEDDEDDDDDDDHHGGLTELV
jgi:hypothetical protein